MLEVACGTGRISVPLARAGHIVTGFDRDTEMLARIPPKAVGLPNLHVREADALCSDWGRDYDVVVEAGNLLINIDTAGDYREAQRLLIHKAAEALRPGGHLYLDFNLLAHPESFFNGGGGIGFEGTDDRGVYGRSVRYGGVYDPVTQMCVSIGHFELTTPEGEQWIIPADDTHLKHIPTLEQTYDWLSDAGLELEQAYGGYHRELIGETTCRAILWARKV